MSSFYINRSRSTWRVMEESYQHGKRKQLTVPCLTYSILGLRSEMSIEEARVRIAEFNKSKLQKNAVGAARRYIDIYKSRSIYLRENLVNEFSEFLQNYCFGSIRHHQRIMYEWSFVQKLIADLKLTPQEYLDNRRRIYQCLSEKQFSLDYSKKLLRILNMWGNFVCRKQGQYYEPIVAPKGVEKQRILEAYATSPRCRSGGSAPLTPLLLEDLKNVLPEMNWNWLYLSVWLGLRPIEIDSLKEKANYKIDAVSILEIKTLWVYQSKLTSMLHERRWKPIPIIYPEQTRAIEILECLDFQRPSLNILKKRLSDRRIGLYGGRKGFTDLMLSKGQKIEDISVWMGHTSIEVTWRYYKNKLKVTYTKPVDGHREGANNF